MAAPEQQNKVRFDKTISLGHLLTTATMVIGLISWGTAIDKRLAVVEEKARQQQQTDAQQDSRVTDAVMLLRNEVSRVADKLDRVLENQSQRRP